MEIVRPLDAAAFLELAGPLLARAEGRNNLILAIAGTAAEHPEAYERIDLWVAAEDGEPVAAALRTPPHNLVLADPASERALDAVVDAIAGPLPGIVGNDPHVHRAAERLGASLGRTPELTLRQGVFELTGVRPVRTAPGAARLADAADRPLVRGWLEEFLIEAMPEPEVHLGQIDHSLEVRHSPPSGGIWLWEDGGEPVSLSGFGGPTPTGMRVGPVYTPPEHRRRGYATALVAELSGWLLATGHHACFLFTDLANPTSNRMYEAIGYRMLAEADEYRFR